MGVNLQTIVRLISNTFALFPFLVPMSRRVSGNEYLMEMNPLTCMFKVAFSQSTSLQP